MTTITKNEKTGRVIITEDGSEACNWDNPKWDGDSLIGIMLNACVEVSQEDYNAITHGKQEGYIGTGKFWDAVLACKSISVIY